jgi:hypothetical protein
MTWGLATLGILARHSTALCRCARARFGPLGVGYGYTRSSRTKGPYRTPQPCSSAAGTSCSHPTPFAVRSCFVEHLGLVVPKDGPKKDRAATSSDVSPETWRPITLEKRPPATRRRSSHGLSLAAEIDSRDVRLQSCGWRRDRVQDRAVHGAPPLVEVEVHQPCARVG